MSRRLIFCLVVTVVALVSVSLTVATAREQEATFSGPAAVTEENEFEAYTVTRDASSPFAPQAPCNDSPSVGGHALNQCQGTSFTLGGDTWYLSVYYTLDTSAADHWIVTDSQAIDVLGWMQEAYERYYEDTGGRTYGSSICSKHIRAKIQKGDGWAGIAWWPNSCYIGLDAPMIRGNGGQHTTYHEMRHKVFQFAYSDCVDDWKSGYDGNADFVEGDADYGPSTVGNLNYYNNNGYNPSKNMYSKGYGNRFIPYYSEQNSLYIGPNGSPGDAWYLSNGMVEHMEFCESYDDLYVERELVQHYTPYSYEELFLNFFAANWANDWADASLNPELHYFEEDVGINFAAIPLDADVSLGGGTQSWLGESPPDKWAGRYYQIRPQAGCPYLEIEVDGVNSAKLGIAIMGADTSAPTSVVYAGWVGEDFVRTIAAHGVHDRVAVSVVAFHNKYDYDVYARCVNPQLEIIEPKMRPNSTLVGEAASPVAFLTHFRVTSSGGNPVRGIPESSLTFDAEGDAASIVADTLVEVGGGEYFAALTPPVKPAGTTYVDLGGCLDGTICDNVTDGLLYVPPGNSDIIILHDASGSMGDIDVPGEGSRLENAQKAAKVIAATVQSGDRVAVMDFSAKDNPSGCGLPGGSGNCEMDIRTHLPRTNITNPGAQIPTIESAIDATTDREWTPVGQGLLDAKDSILALPHNQNPKTIVLLSDGEENVNPLYGDPASGVQTTMIDSGVIVNTVAFGSDSPVALMSQIAADTGGISRYVPTSPGASLLSQESQASRLAAVETILEQYGAPVELASQLAPQSSYYPGQIGLADTYDYYEDEAQGASRVSQGKYVDNADNLWREQTFYVDPSVSQLKLVSAGNEFDVDVVGGCDGYHRSVEVLMPGAGQRDWIPVSPTQAGRLPPASWDIRNRAYVDTVFVPNPEPGEWKVRTKYYYLVCLQSAPAAPQAFETDFLQNASVQSTIHLEAFFLEPFADGQGKAGETLPIVASMMSRVGPMKDAIILALIEKPGAASDLLLLRDDGAHGDGAANDGIYGFEYHKNTIGGAYNVTLAASVKDPSNPSQWLVRAWLGGYYVEGPEAGGNPDDDNIPTWWERQYPCMNPEGYDGLQWDYDEDGADNWTEWENGTNPCDPDTDDGGELDGSEIAGGRDPHFPGDDKVRPIFHWSVRPLNQAVVIRWSRPVSYTHMYIGVTWPGNEENYDGGQTGTFTIPLQNNIAYNITLQGATDDGLGPPTDPEVVTPKADPDAPSGFILINYDAPATVEKDVLLYVNATDELLDGMPAPGTAASVANDFTDKNEVSDNIQMRFSNDSILWSAWEPYAVTKPWTLDCDMGDECYVYVQFKDGAANQSLVTYDTIALRSGIVYLPLVLR